MPQPDDALPGSLTVRVIPRQIDELLDKEWLLSNKIGAYASSSVVGCNTRRYHSLLVAAGSPPVGRIATLSLLMEQLTVGATTFDLATNEFAGTFSPRGVDYLVEFRNDAAPTFVYRAGGVELVKEIILAEQANAVAVRYSLRGGAGALRLWPFLAFRDYHGLRKIHEPHQLAYNPAPGGVIVQDPVQGKHTLHLISKDAPFQAKPQWWYRFCYRADIARGQDGFEDLYGPGHFQRELADGQSLQFTASLDKPESVDFAATVAARRHRLAELSTALGPDAEPPARRLAAASDAFVVQRSFPEGPPSTTILAGFHWFADWGRDTFIALPGLLLATRQYDLAREVFTTFARAIADGMVPNRFDDYTSTPHYNSIDASLWFIVAAERYLAATGDECFWRNTLMPAAQKILAAYSGGTRFDIRAGADGLLSGGSLHTQLTWMDAALGPEVITPRNGKAVEVNALWHCAHRIMAHRCQGADDGLAQHFSERADLIAASFDRAFWNPVGGYLYDCVTDAGADASVRPNQIFAVSLPHSPLSPQQQAAVLANVTGNLLTPLGLRTLSPFDGRYRRRYGGSWESRDRAYHQGTVWAWLIGPYIDAYFNVEGVTAATVQHARELLSGFDEHLSQAGVGYVSEIFDGDPPHTPRGCIAQAWSVGEVLRAKMLVAQKHKELGAQ